MAQYHPLDVRYKGPSTAYTGSARNKNPAAQPVPVVPSMPAVTPKMPAIASKEPRAATQSRQSRNLLPTVLRFAWRTLRFALSPFGRVIAALLLYYVLMKSSGFLGLDGAIMNVSGF